MSTEASEGPVARIAADVAPKPQGSNYPEPFASRMAGRTKRALGDAFGLCNFGVNLTTLAPGSRSALHHRHSRQDEFIFVLRGRPTLHTDEGAHQLEAGMCAGFPAGGTAHHLYNDTTEEAVYLETGDRSEGDEVTYPEDDLKAVRSPRGGWTFGRKDGSPL